MTTETTAARYVGGHAIDVAPVAQRAPGPGEVRIDVAFTGICGTDLHIVHTPGSSAIGANGSAGSVSIRALPVVRSRR